MFGTTVCRPALTRWADPNGRSSRCTQAETACARRAGPRQDPRGKRPCGFLDEAPPTHLGDWHPELGQLSPGKREVLPGLPATYVAPAAVPPPFPDPRATSLAETARDGSGPRSV